MKEIYIRCSCGSEVLHFEREEEDPMLYVTIFSTSSNLEIKTWREKIRWIWHILRNDKVWNDQILLGKEGMNQLKEFSQSL